MEFLDGNCIKYYIKQIETYCRTSERQFAYNYNADEIFIIDWKYERNANLFIKVHMTESNAYFS